MIVSFGIVLYYNGYNDQRRRLLMSAVVFSCRLRDERGESERALALDHKQRDHSSHNGESFVYYNLNFFNNKRVHQGNFETKV